MTGFDRMESFYYSFQCVREFILIDWFGFYNGCRTAMVWLIYFVAKLAYALNSRSLGLRLFPFGLPRSLSRISDRLITTVGTLISEKSRTHLVLCSQLKSSLAHLLNLAWMRFASAGLFPFFFISQQIIWTENILSSLILKYAHDWNALVELCPVMSN